MKSLPAQHATEHVGAQVFEQLPGQVEAIPNGLSPGDPACIGTAGTAGGLAWDK